MKKPVKRSRSKRAVKDLEAKKADARGGFVAAVKVLGPDEPPIRQY